MAKGKSSKKKSGWPKWLTYVLAGVAVAGLMGAFDRLVSYDKENAWIKGVFIAGAAIAGAFALRKTNIIGRGSANTIGAVGIGLGSYVALGPKVYEIGNNVADSFSGMFKRVSGGSRNGTRMADDGLPMNDRDFDALPDPGDVGNAFGPSRAAPTPAPAPTPQPSAPAPSPGTTTIVNEAPEISGTNYLLGKGIDALAGLGGAVLGNPGLFGSGREMTRGRRVMAFGRAA